ncbi:MAG: alpha/beta fold hydrolase, partial [Chloroflexota bacterium]
MRSFTFPVGYHQMHRTKIIDFQLNRWVSLGYMRLADMRAAAANIRTLDDWKDEMLHQADAALDEDRLMNSTFAVRAAEFFTHPSDPDKAALYDRFIDLFYDELFAEDRIERHDVLYGAAHLPAYRVPPVTTPTRGKLLIHGGFDSFKEEFYSAAVAFANQGYDVVVFDGPGQGGALKSYAMPMDIAWEAPVGAVLDHFRWDDVTLLGISMGGWLCFRAAAFEPRISRVIASSIAF